MLPHAEQLRLQQYIVSTHCNSQSLLLYKGSSGKKRKDYAFPLQFNEKPSIVLGCPCLSGNQYVCRSEVLCAGTTHPQGSADGRSPPCQPPPCPQAGPRLRTPTLARSTTSTQQQVCMHLSCLAHAFVPLMSSKQTLNRKSACPCVCHHCLSV